MRNALASLRVRVLLLIAIPFAVMLGLSIYQSSDKYSLRLDAVRGDALHTAKVLASEQQRIIRHTRQVLMNLSAVSAVSRAMPSAQCDAALAEKLHEGPDFVTLLVTLRGGEVICNAVPTPQPINIADRFYFRETLRQRAFVVGEYIISRTAGKPAFGAGVPMLDAAGEVRAVVSASVGLGWLAEELGRAGLPEGSGVMVVDERGTVLARHPDQTAGENGRPAENMQPLIRAMGAGEEGSLVAVGPDGKERIYAFAPLHRVGSSEVRLIVEVPEDVVLAPAVHNFYRTLAIAIMLLLVTFGALWFGGDRLFVRRVVALADSATQLARGNLSARAAFGSGGDEIGTLADSFNRMAESLQRKDRQVSQANRALRVLFACNRAMLQATDEQTLLGKTCREIVEAGGYRMAWVGYADNDAPESVRQMASSATGESFLEDLRASGAMNERGKGPAGRTLSSGKPVLVRNSMSDPDYAPWREFAARYGYGSSIALPLRVEDRVIGALAIYAREADAFGEEEVRLLSDAATELSFGIALQRANAARRQMESEMFAAEQRYHSLLAASPDGIWIHSEARVRYINHALAGMLGYHDADEILGRDIFDFFPSEERESLRERVAYTTTRLQATPLTRTAMLRRDGSRIEVETTAASYWQGAKAWSIAIIRDVTERTRMEQEIRALNEDLERRVTERTAELELTNRELDAFSYSISHDLRAPLRAINGFASILETKANTAFTPEEQKMFGRIAGNAQRMGELIDDLLSFSRVGRGGQTLERVDISALAAEAVNEQRAAYPRTAVELSPLPDARGDASLLRQVLQNLIGNAFKYSGRREGARIEIGAESDGGQTVYFVRDNGAGFDMRYADKLFGVFQRLHDPSEFPGTGVGLAIVKRIIDRHGGRVWAEGSPGAGATIRFTLGRSA